MLRKNAALFFDHVLEVKAKAKSGSPGGARGSDGGTPAKEAGRSDSESGGDAEIWKVTMSRKRLVQ
jgi:hypothetical protein